ncbi:unnamed protein product [Cochlearia groenlandica]
MFEPMFKQNPSPGWKECPPSSDKVSTRKGSTKGGRCGGGRKRLSEIERFSFFCIENEEGGTSFSPSAEKEEPLRCVLSEGSTLFRPRCYDCRSLSSFRPLAYWDSSLRALPAH